MPQETTPTTITRSFVDALRLLRLEKRWTQAAFAKKVGVSNAAVSYWEHGQLPRSDLYMRLITQFPQLAQPELNELFQVPRSVMPTETCPPKPPEAQEIGGHPDAAAVQIVRQLLLANPDLFSAFATAASTAQVDLAVFAHLVKPQ